LPSFLAVFAIGAMSIVLVTFTITRLPLGIGKACSVVLVVAFWYFLARGLWVVLHFPFSITANG
jgi:hypothetical protein